MEKHSLNAASTYAILSLILNRTYGLQQWYANAVIAKNQGRDDHKTVYKGKIA
jgi:hypothetical protein